ncbi:hypothetical protein EDD21DRAFT_372631 [Dissophora ornata]|nr:hypothetical protein EDD21DRAFT_372631 [Dissophora ornata]
MNGPLCFVVCCCLHREIACMMVPANMNLVDCFFSSSAPLKLVWSVLFSSSAFSCLSSALFVFPPSSLLHHPSRFSS